MQSLLYILRLNIYWMKMRIFWDIDLCFAYNHTIKWDKSWVVLCEFDLKYDHIMMELHCSWHFHNTSNIKISALYISITVHLMAMCGVPKLLLCGIAYPAPLGSNISLTLHNASSEAWFLCTPVVYGTLQHCAENNSKNMLVFLFTWWCVSVTKCLWRVQVCSYLSENCWLLYERVAWIDNYMHYKVSDEITYPFPTPTVAHLKFGNG